MGTRLFHISDIHFGAENPEALHHVEFMIDELEPDAVLCTGDLTQRGTHEQFDAASRWLGGLGVPVTIDPGNHDMPYYNLWERMTAPYRRYEKVKNAVSSEFSTDDVVIVPLKTTIRAQPRWPWVDGYVRSKHLNRTVDRLNEFSTDPRIKLVTCHHPLLGPRAGVKNPTIGGPEAFAALAGAGANGVLSGHVHFPFDHLRTVGTDRLRMIGAGTLSTRLRGAPPSFNVIDCKLGEPIQTTTVVAGHNPFGDRVAPRRIQGRALT